MKITLKDVVCDIRNFGFVDEAEFNSSFRDKIYGPINTALSELSATNAKIYKTIRLTQAPLENELSVRPEKIYTHLSDDIIFECSAGRSLYFECDGSAEVYVEELSGAAWNEIKKITTYAEKQFEENRAFFFASAAAEKIRIRFSGSFAYNFKSIAVYKAKYSDIEDDIPAFGEFVKFDIASLTAARDGQRFMCFAENNIIKKLNGYICESDFAIEGKSTILIKRENMGEFIVTYQAYPQQITNTTSDSTVIELEPIAASLVAKYVASQIYKEDEPERCAVLYNEYYQQKAQLYSELPQHSPWVRGV